MTDSCIFFPFSHISRDQLDALQAFFSSFVFFPAALDLKHNGRLQELSEQGAAVPVFSTREALSSVDHSFEQYTVWAKVHKGNEKNLRALLKDNPYFTSDSDLSAIKSQIRATNKKTAQQQLGPNVLHQDLLFLKMAKQCDQENENIDFQLRKIDKNRNRMLSTLLGEEGPMEASETGQEPYIPDPGAIMTRERIEAWSRCMNHSDIFQKAGQNPVFVTTSKDVFDYLETIFPDVINALDIDSIKVHENDCENKTRWQRQLFEQLMCAARGNFGGPNYLPEVNDECSVLGQIKLSLFSGNNSHHLFDLKDKQIPVCLIRLK